MLAAKRNLGTLGPPKKLNIACTDDNQSKVLEHNIIVNNQHGRQPFENFEALKSSTYHFNWHLRPRYPNREWLCVLGTS